MRKAIIYLLLYGSAFALGVGGTTAPSHAKPPPNTQPAYIALGDVAAGAGAADPLTGAYVPLFRSYAQKTLPAHNLVLFDLGHGGDASNDLLGHGHVAQALAELANRNGDIKPSNDVRVITLDVGLLDLFASVVVCFEGPTPSCVHSFDETLFWFSFYFDLALDDLQGAAGPGTAIIAMTYYNPLVNPGCEISFLAPVWDVALEGDSALGLPLGLNDLIRSVAAAHGAKVAELVPAGDFPSLLGPADLQPDCSNPNDLGHAKIAQAFLQASQGDD